MISRRIFFKVVVAGSITTLATERMKAIGTSHLPEPLSGENMKELIS